MLGTTRPRGGADAYPTARDDTAAPSLRATLLPTGLGHVQVLLAGAILAPAQRTVTAALRVIGLGADAALPSLPSRPQSRRWSGLAVSRVAAAACWSRPSCPTGRSSSAWMRRWSGARGAQIAAKGIYRDAVRSSHSHFVKASGLRWVCLMLLVPIPWADRVLGLALPDRPRALRALRRRAEAAAQER